MNALAISSCIPRRTRIVCSILPMITLENYLLSVLISLDCESHKITILLKNTYKSSYIGSPMCSSSIVERTIGIVGILQSSRDSTKNPKISKYSFWYSSWNNLSETLVELSQEKFKVFFQRLLQTFFHEFV